MNPKGKGNQTEKLDLLAEAYLTQVCSACFVLQQTLVLREEGVSSEGLGSFGGQNCL